MDADKRACKACMEEEEGTYLLDAGGAFCLCICASFAADLFDGRASSQSKLGSVRRMSCSCRHNIHEGRRSEIGSSQIERHKLGTCSASAALPFAEETPHERVQASHGCWLQAWELGT